tara:strand:+ start:12439 stop:12846 length:408 start_codon:yes stop_codon:yes gene_type:complete
MNKIGLISCVSKKQIGNHKAKDLYISSLFKKSKKFVEKFYDNYYILSAKYGLLDKNEYIDNYNLTLNNMDHKKRQLWSIYVAKQISNKISKQDQLFILAGSKYYKDLLKYIPNKTNIIMEGMSIGKRLQYLNKKI